MYPDAINPSAIVVHRTLPDITSWPATTRLEELDVRPAGVFVGFGKKDGPDRWPDVVPPSWTGPLQYCLCFVFNVKGQWQTGAMMSFWHGADVTNGGPVYAPGQIPNNWLYSPEWEDLFHYQPAPGEQVGAFVVAGALRFDTHDAPLTVKERSNIVTFPWPVAPQRFTFSIPVPEPGPEPQPVPQPPTPLPVPPVCQFNLAPILARLDALEALIKAIPAPVPCSCKESDYEGRMLGMPVTLRPRK